MRRLTQLAASGVLVAAAAATASTMVGFDWVQDCGMDAGSFPGTAQAVTAPGPVGSISGCLGASVLDGPSDTEDMYLINIAEPDEFFAQTLEMTPFNPQLFLFRADGRGLLANNNIQPGDQEAQLLPIANDGSGAQLDQPGLYLLAISASGNDPISDGGPIFNLADPAEISGPDGPGGGQQIVDWGAQFDFAGGEYTIMLNGVVGVPSPAGVPAYSPLSIAIISVIVIGAAVVLLRR